MLLDTQHKPISPALLFRKWYNRIIMINLFPISEKKKIRKDYLLRLSVVVLFFVSGLIVISIVLLFPKFILSSFEYSIAQEQLIKEKENLKGVNGTIDPIKIATDTNNKLNILKKEGYKTPMSSEVISVVVDSKPVNIKIGSIFYDRSAISGKVTISGISKDRETLLSFLRSVETNGMFSDVDLPISSFVEGRDIEFSIIANIIIDGNENTKAINNDE